jgi:hypothetical protein
MRDLQVRVVPLTALPEQDVQIDRPRPVAGARGTAKVAFDALEER